MNPLRPTHLRYACQLLHSILQGGTPADALLARFFSQHREMGRRDRAQVSDAIYGVLRDLRALEWHSGGREPHDLIAAWQQGGTDRASLPDAVRRNLPDALHAELAARLPPAELDALATALRTAAPVDLRVNTLRSTREAIQRELLEAGYAATPTPYSPWGLRLQQRLPMTLAALRDGRLEPQDEGSQLLAQVVRAQPGARVLDACAGAGGKTLALAAMMQDRGELVAEDHDPARLKRLAPRAARAGLRCLRQQAGGAFDAVLVDAPCSGSGRLRRSPEACLLAPDLDALHAQQLAILGAAATRVKPGGQLVYATCSFSARENHEVVDAFLASHPAFAREDLRQRPGWAALALDGPDLQLWPHRHQTDGFYAASLLHHG